MLIDKKSDVQYFVYEYKDKTNRTNSTNMVVYPVFPPNSTNPNANKYRDERKQNDPLYQDVANGNLVPLNPQQKGGHYEYNIIITTNGVVKTSEILPSGNNNPKP